MSSSPRLPEKTLPTWRIIAAALSREPWEKARRIGGKEEELRRKEHNAMNLYLPHDVPPTLVWVDKGEREACLQRAEGLQ